MPPGGLQENQRAWSSEETVALLHLQKLYGNRWKLCGLILNRSQSSTRNKFQRMAAADAKVNRCRKCGAFRRGHVCLTRPLPAPPPSPPLAPPASATQLLGDFALAGIDDNELFAVVANDQYSYTTC